MVNEFNRIVRTNRNLPNEKIYLPQKREKYEPLFNGFNPKIARWCVASRNDFQRRINIVEGVS